MTAFKNEGMGGDLNPRYPCRYANSQVNIKLINSPRLKSVLETLLKEL